MAVEATIDDLIQAGWNVVDSDFDPVAFLRWRRRAFDCLTDMLGPDHHYSRQFAVLVRQGEKTETVAAVGILSTAKRQMAGNRPGPST